MTGLRDERLSPTSGRSRCHRRQQNLNTIVREKNGLRNDFSREMITQIVDISLLSLQTTSHWRKSVIVMVLDPACWDGRTGSAPSITLITPGLLRWALSMWHYPLHRGTIYVPETWRGVIHMVKTHCLATSSLLPCARNIHEVDHWLPRRCRCRRVKQYKGPLRLWAQPT